MIIEIESEKEDPLGKKRWFKQLQNILQSLLHLLYGIILQVWKLFIFPLKSSWAVLFAALTTGIGIRGFYAMVDGQRKIIAPLIIVSAALGAFLSITWS